MKTKKKKSSAKKNLTADPLKKVMAKSTKAGRSSKEATEADNWPTKRRVFFRPERYKYIKKIDQPATCVFCGAHQNSVSFDSLCVYKSEHSMILLNKYPYNNGHLLILPRRHIGELLKLTDAEYTDLMSTVRLATQAITDIYNPAAMNLGMNHGALAGAGIPDHLHFHIVPRWSGDLNFFPLIAETKVVIETLEQTYQHFVGYFNKGESQT